MFVMTGFRKYEIYSKNGRYIKTVYTSDEAKWEQLNGYDVKIIYVDSIK